MTATRGRAKGTKRGATGRKGTKREEAERKGSEGRSRHPDISMLHPGKIPSLRSPLKPGAEARKRRLLCGRPIWPKGITGKESLPDLIDDALLAYNGGRLAEACRLFSEKMLRPDVTVAMSLAGALTPAGLGESCIIPLIDAGFVDWIVTTGANMYHDAHFALNLPLHKGRPDLDDASLRKMRVTRIYDILVDAEHLQKTDRVLSEIMAEDEFQHEMGTAEFYYRLGLYLDRFEALFRTPRVSVVAAAYRAGVPVYTSAPGDSTIGLNMAAMELEEFASRINSSIDVNETSAIVYDAKSSGGRHAALVIGGGSPKNFLLQTEPQLQDVLGLPEVGQDFFIQFTDARPDTGGLSGATPAEAVSWGKLNPDTLPDMIVCYLDATAALPIFTHYALARHKPRPLRRLYDRRAKIVRRLRDDFLKYNKAKGRLLRERRRLIH